MKVKNLTVGIKSLEQALKEAAQTMKEIQKGHSPKPTRGTYFVTFQAMLKVLTPKRLELLRTIREKHPKSVYELAAITHRHIKNVQEDVDFLNRVDLVSISRKSTTRRRVVPTVNYDQLNFRISFI